MRSPLTAEAIWQTGHVDRDEPAPVALRLTAAGHDVWIVVAEDYTREPHYGRFLLGSDEVLVTGDTGFARELGLVGARP